MGRKTRAETVAKYNEVKALIERGASVEEAVTKVGMGNATFYKLRHKEKGSEPAVVPNKRPYMKKSQIIHAEALPISPGPIHTAFGDFVLMIPMNKIREVLGALT